MRNDSPKTGTDTDAAGDLLNLADAPRGSAQDRPGSRVRRTAVPEEAVSAQPVACGDVAPDLLGEISDSLLIAYRLARQDGDPLTVALIGKALMHTGRRLAAGMSPSDAGIACH